MEYEQPRRRLRSFGTGLLSGNILSKDGAVQQIQENINFRLSSARQMLSGLGSGQSEMAPMQRRREIRDRQMNLLNLSGMGSRSSSSGSSGRTSGSIGESTSTKSSSSSRSKDSGVPDMSEVQSGTRGRALERGFDG